MRLLPQDRIKAILGAEVDSSTKLLLMALSSYLTDDPGAWCWPAPATIATETGLSLRKVKSTLATAHAAGWIEREYRGKRSKSTRIAWASLPQRCTTCTVENDKGAGAAPLPLPAADPKGAPPAPQRCTTCTPKGAPRAPDPTREPPRDPTTPPAPPAGGSSPPEAEPDFGLSPEVRDTLRWMVGVTADQEPDVSMLDPPGAVVENAQAALRKRHPGASIRKRALRAAIVHFASQLPPASLEVPPP